MRDYLCGKITDFTDTEDFLLLKIDEENFYVRVPRKGRSSVLKAVSISNKVFYLADNDRLEELFVQCNLTDMSC